MDLKSRGGRAYIALQIHVCRHIAEEGEQKHPGKCLVRCREEGGREGGREGGMIHALYGALHRLPGESICEGPEVAH